MQTRGAFGFWWSILLVITRKNTFLLQMAQLRWCFGWNNWRVITALHSVTLYVRRSEKNMFFFMFVGAQRHDWRLITGLKSLLRSSWEYELCSDMSGVRRWPPEGTYWIVMTLASDGAAGRWSASRARAGDDFGSTWCSWEIDSGWRCHTLQQPVVCGYVIQSQDTSPSLHKGLA